MRRSSTLPGKTLGLMSLALLAVTLAACGSGDPAASAADADAKAETARVRLEQCLRENGMEVRSSADGRRTMMRDNNGKGRAAMEKCRKYQQEAFGSITPEQRQEFQDAATKFAACMRQNGVDMPDPVAGGGPEVRRRAGSAAGVNANRESPKVQAAMKACEDKLPRGGPGGGIRLGGPVEAK